MKEYKTTFTQGGVGNLLSFGVKSVNQNEKPISVTVVLQDDEFAIYQSNQQRLRYLIEFTLPGDKPLPVPQQLTKSVTSPDFEHLDFSDIMSGKVQWSIRPPIH